MGLPVVVKASGGLPVTVVTNGLPVTVATNGFGVAVTQATAGLGVTGVTFGPDVTAPIITSTNAVSNVENTVLAHTLTANETVTWAIVAGGADNARFELSGSTLRWLANGVKDFETPNDADVNNTYVVTVRATDTAANPSTTQTITVTVLNALAAAVPSLDLLTDASDTTPDFTLTGDLVIGDTVRFQYSTSAVFSGASELTNAIDAGEDAANAISFSTGALGAGTWYFRARIERPDAPVSGWSNTETITFAGPAYTGPGDIVSGALGWWGLSAYNAAYCTGSNPCIDITDQADANALTVNILTDGTLDTATIAAWVTTHSVTSIKIAKIYNQSGGAFGDLPAVPGYPPRLELNATGLGAGKATMRFYQASPEYFAAFETSGSGSVAQPYSTSVVTSVDSTANTFVWGSNPTENFHYTAYRTSGFVTSSGNAELVGVDASAVDFHAIQTTANDDGTNSIYTNGVNTSGTTGGTTDFSGVPLRVGGGPSSVMTGRICEFGIWPGVFSAGNKSDLNTNQHTRWSF